MDNLLTLTHNYEQRIFASCKASAISQSSVGSKGKTNANCSVN